MLVSFWTSRSSIPEIMSWRLLTGLVVAAAVAPAQTKPASTGPQRLDITLERQEGRKWIVVPPGLVFQKNDEIRFRVRPNFDGYLYVMNYGTSGQYAMLFPREETGLQNQIKAGAEYIVPATKTAFRIDGPPGHDIVYWIVSPLSLGDKPGYLPLPPPPSKEIQPLKHLTPRCDETLFRARSLCIDSSAGPRNITAEEKLPDSLARLSQMGSRDLVIIHEKEHSVVSSPSPLQGPVLYEFRVAHQ
jgi:Domain of unknown function (DUF4384)